MNKPLLVVITGRPASGKTTLAHILSKEIKCPLISRDELKEGYVHTTRVPHNQLDPSVNWHIYETFFQTIDLLISRGVSIVIEAAFQHKVWKPKLSDLLEKADIKIIICGTTPDVAKKRFINRLLSNPDRDKFHGDNSVIYTTDESTSLIENYERLSMNLPTLEVSTTDNYNPAIENIINFIEG